MKNFAVFVVLGLSILSVIVGYTSCHIFEGFGKCRTASNQIGICLPLEHCPFLRSIALKKSLKRTDRTFLRRSRCGFIGQVSLLCCSMQQQNSIITKQTERVQNSFDPLPTTCGKSQIKQQIASHLVVGGEAARIVDSPWLALLQYSKPTGTGFHCGGALITNNLVLTAAHCVAEDILKRNEMHIEAVRLGEWDLTETNDCQDDLCSNPVVDIPIARIISHENYGTNSTDLSYDIALIQLKRNVSFSDWIQPLCLPHEKRLQNVDYSNIPLTIDGWDSTAFLDNEGRRIKQSLILNGVPINRCKQIYQRYNNLTLSDRHLCAGGKEGRDSCRGDSGSPLTKFDDEQSRWYIVGIVSFGLSKCAVANRPAVYTRVDKYTDWLLDKIQHIDSHP